MIFRTLEAIKEVLRQPDYCRYLWARLHHKPPNAGTEGLRLYLPSENPSADSNLSPAPRNRALPKVRNILFTGSPYAGFNPEGEPDDLQGWGSDDPVLEDAIRLLRPGRVCVVGSWKGRSAVRMARVVR
jgi:hypothetical protein